MSELDAVKADLARRIAYSEQLYHALCKARNERWEECGFVCATCGHPAESEPCPEHSPVRRA